jgi:hypothetical protein
VVVNVDGDHQIPLLHKPLFADELEIGVPSRVFTSARGHGRRDLHVRVNPCHCVRAHLPSKRLHIFQVLCGDDRQFYRPLFHVNRCTLSSNSSSCAKFKLLSYRPTKIRNSQHSQTFPNFPISRRGSSKPIPKLPNSQTFTKFYVLSTRSLKSPKKILYNNNLECAELVLFLCRKLKTQFQI